MPTSMIPASYSNKTGLKTQPIIKPICAKEKTGNFNFTSIQRNGLDAKTETVVSKIEFLN